MTLLDGDDVRRMLSGELDFWRAHREISLRRIGFIAVAIARSGGIAICAQIAPDGAARRELRETVEAGGGFVEVHVSTPREICVARDRKGLYAKARAGFVEGFAGIDEPYEPPANPDAEIDTAAERIFAKIESLGFVGSARHEGAPQLGMAASGTGQQGVAVDPGLGADDAGGDRFRAEEDPPLARC